MQSPRREHVERCGRESIATSTFEVLHGERKGGCGSAIGECSRERVQSGDVEAGDQHSSATSAPFDRTGLCGPAQPCLRPVALPPRLALVVPRRTSDLSSNTDTSSIRAALPTLPTNLLSPSIALFQHILHLIALHKGIISDSHHGDGAS